MDFLSSCFPHDDKNDSRSLSATAEGKWDAIVVGAGPAGSMAAYELARRSLRVLLVDKSAFPRPKTCGCCLNGQTLALLREQGLSHATNGAVQLRQVLLASRGLQAVIPLPTGVALSREALDMRLTHAAIQTEVAFQPNTIATLGEITSSGRQVILRSSGLEREVDASIVLVADGLGGVLSRPRKCNAQSRSQTWAAKAWHTGSPLRPCRIGAATIINNCPSYYQPGTIYMASGRGGYVGLVRLEDGRLNVAAAFDFKALKSSGHPGKLAAAILQAAGLPPISTLAQASWKGTPPLTRRTERLAAERLFVLGDAAGFVEPFTGEGIAWALRAAVAVAPVATRAVQNWHPDLQGEWTTTFRQTVGRRQMLCRAIVPLLGSPALSALAVRLLAWLPSLSRPMLRALNGSPIFNIGISS